MDLTTEQLMTVRERISDGGNLQEILTQEFPDVTLWVVRGQDNFSHESYTADAYFTEPEAREAYNKLREEHPRHDHVSINDSFDVINGTVDALERGNIRDSRACKFGIGRKKQRRGRNSVSASLRRLFMGE
mgnify:CR=1 FL=1